MYSMSDTTVKTTGRVKWFNKNSGYGFITAVDGDHSEEDIFVHHSALTVDKDQFRYLVDGEYVSFVWADSGKDSKQHKWQATDVMGICGGPLLCETQNASRENSSSRGHCDDDDDDGDGCDDEGSSGGSSSHQQRRFRGGTPHFTDSRGEEYRLIRNRVGGGRGRQGGRTSNGKSSTSTST